MDTVALVTEDPYWWLDRGSAWWAKMDRAEEHLDDLEGEVGQFIRGGTYEVELMPGAVPHETDLRLRISRPIPVRFSTMIGDVLHNLRSALDCVAFELARRHVGRELTEDEQQACEFPIKDELHKVDAFFRQRPRPILYGPRERRAVREVQPGRLHDEMTRLGLSRQRGRAQEVRWDSLTLLNRLSNVDKHRTLHLVGWWPDLFYWSSSEGDPERGWRWGRPPFEDGALLGTLIDDPARPAPLPDLHHEMQLRLFQPPEAGRSDVIWLLTRIHQQLGRTVIPRVLNPYWLDGDGRTAEERATDDPGQPAAPPAGADRAAG